MHKSGVSNRRNKDKHKRLTSPGAVPPRPPTRVVYKVGACRSNNALSSIRKCILCIKTSLVTEGIRKKKERLTSYGLMT